MILRWILNALALILVSYILAPGFQVDSFWVALLTALVLGLVNALVRPILLILTLPINIITLGLFTFVVNALMILLVANIVPGFTVDGFGSALIAALLLWVISWFTNNIDQPHERVIRNAHSTKND